MRITRTLAVLSMALSFSAPAFSQDAAFPAEGERITLVVGSGAGGSADLFYRLLADGLEKEIGRSIEVVNRAGSGTQFALQALSTAEPDGYTIGQLAMPTAIMVSLDPNRQAQFGEDSFIPVAMATFDPGATAVHADSPYQTLEDLVAAAKAAPGTIKFGAGSRLTRQHFDALKLEEVAGVEFQKVHADSAANPVTMLLGGHLDVVQESVGDFQGFAESDQLRILGVWDTERSPLAPDVPTMAEQGYDVQSGSSRGIIVPAGTPEEVVAFWEDAIAAVVESEEFKEGMANLNQPIRYVGHDEYLANWNALYDEITPLMEAAQ